MFSLCLELITRDTSRLIGLARFRPQQLAVTIHAAPAAIDESHRFAAHRALRRRPLIEDREHGQFKIVVVVINHGMVLLLVARFHFKQQGLLLSIDNSARNFAG